ncbi:MAG: UDP-phosphate galactose phosphotransferase [Rhodospirillales bacterium]|nr:UDP-phosphate galactose phosphotransferase [Rhodospirillales bacterium]
MLVNLASRWKRLVVLPRRKAAVRFQSVTSPIWKKTPMQSPTYANFQGPNFTARTATRHMPADSYNWSRLHAAAVDRCFVERAGNIDIAPAQQLSKRMFDFMFGMLLIVGLSPILLLIAFLAQRDGGPVLFGHRRIGQDGRTFVCWKFRTMVMNADSVLKQVLTTDPEAKAEWEATFKLKRDPRITKIGQFLRTTSLDELPQLFNVIKGEMSLVGPRPIVADEVRRYGAAFRDYMRCRPGITGLWQVSGRSDVDYRGRVRLDQHYAKSCSLATDVKLLWRTAFVVIQRRGAY